MKPDHVQLLTEARSRSQAFHSGDTKHVLDSLSVKTPKTPQDSIKNFIATEPEETPTPGEGPAISAMMTGLSWVTYVLAIAAALVLTWATGDGFGG